MTDNQATVKFSKEFITPSGLKEWVGVEWPVGLEVDKDAIFATLDKVRDAVLDWHHQNNTPPTHIDMGFGNQPIQWGNSTQAGNKSRAETILEGINSCTAITVLKSYHLMAKQDPATQAAYDAKLNELSNK